MNRDNVPNPGSEKALDLGCECPVIDNHHGEGRPDGNGGREFIYVKDCPVHDDS